MSTAQPGASGVAIGTTLSHYRVDALLGEGGMGVVYRARDERLKRDVALKIVAPGRVTEDDRRRLRREALALSQLNHPNIQIVYDFDSDHGLDFLITEYVPGQTLRERLAEGALPTHDVMEIAAQLAEGLAAAHARGIVHRDLKPENLKLTPEGRLKILDFGIARSSFVATDTMTHATTDVAEQHAVIGTLPYMSPEKLRGEIADARSDVFSAGCVIYELCTARRAFTATPAPRLIDSILHETPPFDRSIPAVLQRIIRRCLQKQPRDRYQSAAELANDLRGAAQSAIPRRAFAAAAAAAAALIVAGTVVAIRFWPASPRVHSIAVLPLQNLSGDPQQEYFADGMTDALITDLGRLGSQRVIARGSMMRYKGTRKSLPEIAQELNVDALVSGAVVREGNRVRVTAELIDPKTQAQLWSDRYEADLRNILGLQSDLASAIASKIKGKLSPTARRAHAVNSEAFDDYMKALTHKYRATPQEVTLEMQYLQLAVEKDPEFAAAHAAIAGAWAARVVYAFASPRTAGPPARAEAMKALALDEESAEAHLGLAVVKHYMDWDWSGAEREYRRAIELNPSSPDIRFQYATLLGPSLGRFDDWKIQMDRCLELDPLSQFYRFFRGRHLMTLRKPEESIASLLLVQQKAPDFTLIHDGLWYAYESTGKYDQALAEAEKSFAIKNDSEVAAAIHQSRGDHHAAMRRVAEIFERRSTQGYISAGSIARLYTFAREKEKALAWLQRAYETRDQGLATLKMAPVWDPLRGDPRFEDLVKRMNFPPG
ncbi:MAG TPA: protein kinase [Thermoanaerobaculia bacterium]|nr:protein kinase [Thermoanaerobaculia bacterium]